MWNQISFIFVFTVRVRICVKRKSAHESPRSLFVNKVTGLMHLYNLYKTPIQVFSCELCENLRTSFFIKHLWWLLLSYDESWSIRGTTQILLKLTRNELTVSFLPYSAFLSIQFERQNIRVLMLVLLLIRFDEISLVYLNIHLKHFYQWIFYDLFNLRQRNLIQVGSSYLL